MSSWAKKLETKLSALSENSSKESIQTLAKWIGFNRKHAATFADVLSQRLLSSDTNRTVTLSVIHQVLLLDKNVSSKWDKLLELRVVLGETVLLPNAATLSSSLTQQYLKEWDSANVFGGPTLVNQLKRQLATTSGTKSPTPLSPKATTAKESTQADDKATSTKETTTTKTPTSLSGEKEITSSATKEKMADVAPATTTTTKEPPTTAATTKQPSSTTTTTETESDKEKSAAASKPEPPVEKTKSQNEQKAPAAAAATSSTPAASPSRRSSLTTTTVYDLEAKGIPPAPVQMKQLQEPCRSVATLQIARDLRNDSAQQLSGILTELPEAVQALVTKVQTAKDVEPLDDDKARDLSIQTNDTAIDLDVSDQLANIRMFREILEKQRQARTQLIQLLIQSRCHFGAQEAAQAFAQATRAKSELQARKQVLLDAMDLEGLELPAEDKTRTEAADQALAEAEQMTLAWYNSTATTSTAGDQEPDAKKPRIAQDG